MSKIELPAGHRLIGYSLSRCVLDIIEERVDLDQVDMIVARTRFDPEDNVHWKGIWKGYTVPNGWSDHTWANHLEREEDFRSLVVTLYGQDKLYQPRREGLFPRRRLQHWQAVYNLEGLN